MLRGYLDAEHRNKKKKPFDWEGWEDYTDEVCTMRPNEILVFMLTYAMTAGHAAARERLRLRCIHLPVPRVAVSRFGKIPVPTREHGVSPQEDDMGDRAR